MGDIARKILVSILVKVIGDSLTPESVKKAAEELLAWGKEQVAKTPTTVDDKVVAAVDKIVHAGDLLGDATEAVVLLADSIADATSTQVDDAVVEAVAEALDVELPKE